MQKKKKKKKPARPANIRNAEQRGSYSLPDIFLCCQITEFKTEYKYFVDQVFVLKLIYTLSLSLLGK